MAGLPELTGFMISAPRTKLVIPLSLTFDVAKFSENKIPQNKSGRQCLYIPSERSFKDWDIILHLPGPTPTVVFIQVSKSLPKYDFNSGQYRSVTGSTRFLFFMPAIVGPC